MIHESAIIDPSAKLGDDVEIGPWTYIGADVEIGSHTRIGPHVVIKGPTKIGAHNQIYSFCSLGEDSQDKKYQGEDAYLEIGDHNVIREFCSFNRGSECVGSTTAIGSHNHFLAYSHVAHDCKVGSHIVFSNNATLAGHVTVEDYVILSGFAAVHQFCHVGEHAFIGKGSIVSKDVLPYVLVEGMPPKNYGLNTVGLKRRGFDEPVLDALKAAYKIVFRSNLTVEHALKELEQYTQDFKEVAHFAKCLQDSTRGVTR